MGDSSPEVVLQPSIEQLITKICSEKCIEPPNVSARRKLSTINEATAIEILNTIDASSKVRTFSGFIFHLVKDKSGAVSSPKDACVLPQKRSPPISFTAGDSQKYTHYMSPNSNQFAFSPASSSTPVTIPKYFPRSPNDGYGSLISKKITYLPFSCLKDAIPKNVTFHLGESSKGMNRVQKQLIFSTDCDLDETNHSEVNRHLFDLSNDGQQFSVVQEQRTLSPCSTTGANRSHFYDISSSSVTHNGSLIPICESIGGPRNNLVISQQSLLLAELEFRKLFMVYSYVGRKKLEDVIDVEDCIEIKSMKTMTMFDFEANIWAKYGCKFCEPCDRAMHLDWDSGKTHLYHCYVSIDGTYQFKGPYLNERRNHLQRELGDDNVLIVQFVDDPNAHDMPYNHCSWIAAYNLISGGISVGLRHYRLFAYKDVDKNNKGHNSKKPRSNWKLKCYFIRKESHAPWVEKDDCILLRKTNHEARCLFMHVHMVSSMAKYVSRCSLALSNTIKLRVDLSLVHVERIEDIPCRDENGFVVCDEDGEPMIHTDGTGFISEDLAILCEKDFNEAKGTKHDNYEFVDLLKLEEELSGIKGKESFTREPPLLVQCRVFKEGIAVKGTLLVNKKLKPRTIQVRPSMIKVEKDSRLSDSVSFSSLEINSISRRPRRTNLSKNLIALLTIGGVPKNYFLDLLENSLQEAQKVSSSMRAAVKVGLNYSQMDDNATSVAMIGSGIPLDEPYLQYRLSILANEERKGLRTGKLPVNESFYLIGTADPTGTLNNDEVCIIL